jgi:hypothetical protein
VGEAHLAPSAQLRWQLSEEVIFSGGYSRRYQFAQSLRNPESLVGTIFPADLYVAAGDSVPVATSDNGYAALELRPTHGIRIGAQCYARTFDSVVIVAAQDFDPFATTGFAVGRGNSRGAAIELGANGARYGFLATYGLQRVRYEFADTTYVPDFGAAHTIDAGVTVFPTATTDVRLGVSSALGRRATATLGPFEWEASNLLDQGSEFGGSPSERLEPLGGTRLPHYMRVDLGVRKHWHLKIAGREGMLAVFGTATNLLQRSNALTVVHDPTTGQRTEIEMRPRSPLVLGIDWRF